MGYDSVPPGITWLDLQQGPDHATNVCAYPTTERLPLIGDVACSRMPSKPSMRGWMCEVGVRSLERARKRRPRKFLALH